MKTIKVNTLTSAVSQKSGDTYWKAETNEGKMSIFEKDVHDAIYPHIGKPISVTITERGQYKNITGVAKELPDNDPAPADYNPQGVDKDMKIVRQCCLKASVVLGITGEEEKQTIARAQAYVDWVYS